MSAKRWGGPSGSSVAPTVPPPPRCTPLRPKAEREGSPEGCAQPIPTRVPRLTQRHVTFCRKAKCAPARRGSAAREGPKRRLTWRRPRWRRPRGSLRARGRSWAWPGLPRLIFGLGPGFPTAESVCGFGGGGTPCAAPRGRMGRRLPPRLSHELEHASIPLPRPGAPGRRRQPRSKTRLRGRLAEDDQAPGGRCRGSSGGRLGGYPGGGKAPDRVGGAAAADRQWVS